MVDMHILTYSWPKGQYGVVGAAVNLKEQKNTNRKFSPLSLYSTLIIETTETVSFWEWACEYLSTKSKFLVSLNWSQNWPLPVWLKEIVIIEKMDR